MQNDILISDCIKLQASWWITVEAWLKMKGHITVFWYHNLLKCVAITQRC
jgi:hypothetical protein